MSMMFNRVCVEWIYYNLVVTRLHSHEYQPAKWLLLEIFIENVNYVYQGKYPEKNQRVLN
jgi:hypothetical protein